jgi:hypothetical protein
MWGAFPDEGTGLPFTISACPRQRSHSRVWVPRDSWPYFTVSESRLPQPGGPGPRIFIPQDQSGPVIPPGTGFPFPHLLRLAGLQMEVFEPTYTRGWLLLGSNLLQSYVTTNDQSASLSWNKAPIWGLRPDFYYYKTVAGLLMWGALSDERMGLSFTIAAGLVSAFILGSESRGTRDHILSQIRDLSSSSPSTSRATVEVFDPASTRKWLGSESESELLYDWRFTANQFVLAPAPWDSRPESFSVEHLRS